jgi:hypothetical protein
MSLRLIVSAPSSDFDYRADLIHRYLAARHSRVRKALLAEAARYDLANPGAYLRDELLGAGLGDVA